MNIKDISFDLRPDFLSCALMALLAALFLLGVLRAFTSESFEARLTQAEIEIVEPN